MAVEADKTKWERDADALPNARRMLVYTAVAIVLLAFTVLGGTLYAMSQINDVVADHEMSQARLAMTTLSVATQLSDSGLPQKLVSFGLDNARIAAASTVTEQEVAIPIPASDRMLIWTPRRLGTELFAQLAPMRVAFSLMFMLGTAFFMRRMYLLARELEARRAQAQALATRDALTGLGNRLAFDEGIERMLIEGMGELALFYLDLDGFKQVNDTLGHGAGDDVLRTIGARLAGLVQPDDLLVRLGGDEFVVLRPEYESPQELTRLALAIERALADPVQLGARALQVGVSIGIATAPADGSSGTALLEAADKALYRAKRDRSGFAVATAA